MHTNKDVSLVQVSMKLGQVSSLENGPWFRALFIEGRPTVPVKGLADYHKSNSTSMYIRIIQMYSIGGKHAPLCDELHVHVHRFEGGLTRMVMVLPEAFDPLWLYHMDVGSTGLLLGTTRGEQD